MPHKQPTPAPNRLPDGSIDVRYEKPLPSPAPPPARVFDLVDEIALSPRAMARFDRDLASARRRLVRLNATVKPERGPR